MSFRLMRRKLRPLEWIQNCWMHFYCFLVKEIMKWAEIFTGWFYYISLDSCKVWKHLQTLYQCCAWALKPLHTIGKVYLNASILHKNQEICNKTNLWKFQLISLFLRRENSKNAFSIFVFILMARVFVSRGKNSLLDLVSLIIWKR